VRTRAALAARDGGARPPRPAGRAVLAEPVQTWLRGPDNPSLAADGTEAIRAFLASADAAANMGSTR
jgi:hypothetical protein